MCALIYLCGISGNGRLFFYNNRTKESIAKEKHSRRRREEEEEEDPFFVRDFVLLSLSTQDRKT